MNENQINSETGNQRENQPSNDMGREYQNPNGDNSNIMDVNDKATPNEFPERNHQYDHKDPSFSSSESKDEEENTDEEVFDQDDDDDDDDVNGPIDQSDPEVDRRDNEV